MSQTNPVLGQVNLTSNLAGMKLVLTIVVLGSLLGWLAQWRKSLRPGMLSHFLQDAIGGIILGKH